MKCPKCGSTNSQMTISNDTRVHTKNRGYGWISGCCGLVLMGPLGLLCGLCGSGKSRSRTETKQNEYWVCQECGARFTAAQAENVRAVPVRFYFDSVNEFIEFQENPLIKQFIKNYGESWGTSVLGSDMIIRKTDNNKFEKHKNSCEAGWFSNNPIIFALEEQSGVILTPQSIIIDTVCLPLKEIRYISIFENTIYVNAFCVRFSSVTKAEYFYSILQTLFESMTVQFQKFDTYLDLLALVQNYRSNRLINQSSHFSSQKEYAAYVSELTERGMKKLEECRPDHYRNYIQAKVDQNKLTNPPTIMFVIQLVVILVLRWIFKGFLNALLITALWGGLLFIVYGIYITAVQSGFNKKVNEYLPEDLKTLIEENEHSSLEKTGNIHVYDREKYDALEGIYELKDVEDKKSIKKKQIILYIVLAVFFLVITCYHLVTLSSSGSNERVDKVKNGYLGYYNESTIDEVFRDVLGKGTWDEMLTDTSEFYIVQYEVESKDTVIQFKGYPEEETFTVYFMKYMGETMPEASDCKIKLDEIYGKYFEAHPALGGKENDSWENITTNGSFTPVKNIVRTEETEVTPKAASANFILPDSDKQYLTDVEIGMLEDNEKLFAMYEILARHGAIFSNVEDGASIQMYFNSQDWYTPLIPVEEIYEEDLNAYEVENVKKISTSLAGVTEESVEAYILPYSDGIYYTEADLAGLSKADLRLARNEIYARHGRKFETDDLNQYFSSQPWYSGHLSAEEFDDTVLNDYERANLDLIKGVESGESDGTSMSSLRKEQIFTEYNINGQGTWSRSGNDIYMIPSLQTYERIVPLIEFSCEPNTYSYAMYYTCEVDETKSTPNGGLECSGKLYDYHTGDILGKIKVTWESAELLDYPTVKVIEGNVDIGGDYQYWGLSQ